MQLHNLEYTKGSRNQKIKRVGRGHGSGMGKTSTRGQDGQKSRKSGHTRLAFEGGQTPLYRRVPKIGFNNCNFANNYNVITLKQLQNIDLKEINLESLNSVGLIKNSNWKIKIIGNTEIKKSFKISVHKISQQALKILQDSKSEINIIK